MGQLEADQSSFASRYFKLDYFQPALRTGNAYFNDRPLLTTFSAIFFALSVLPVLAFLGIFLFTSVSFFLIALAVAFITSSAVFVGLSAILATILLGAFFASVFFTLVSISGYFFFRFCVLVKEGGVSGIGAWACEIKSYFLNVTPRQNGYQAHSQDNQSDTNESVIIHEHRSLDHKDESDDVKVQAAD